MTYGVAGAGGSELVVLFYKNSEETKKIRALAGAPVVGAVGAAPGGRNRLYPWYSSAKGIGAMDVDKTRKTPARAQLLEAAEAAVLAKGFSGTSIDELIAAVGISKSGFFYHFRDKTELAKALLVRYVEQDDRVFDDVFARADALSEDPLHSFLIALKMLAQIFEDLPNGHPGCMVASICYHDQLFDREVREINQRAVLSWRRRFRERLERVAAAYPPKLDVDLDDVADMLSVIADGGIILSKVTADPKTLPRQLLLYRDFIRLVFQG
ncbi:MAG: TetR/AcrR family transcriptional regulator [Pseudomonadota bacterium]